MFKLYSDGDAFDTTTGIASVCFPQGPEARSYTAMDLMRRSGTMSMMDISSEIGLSEDKTCDLMEALAG